MAVKGTSGLGYRRHERKLEPRQKLIQRMKDEAEAKRMSMLHDYQMQASWVSWGLDNMMKQDRSWQVLLYQYSQRLLQFILNSQLNTLPSPDNLRRWNANKDAICGLCTQKNAILCHILAGCPWVRGAENKLAHHEDRYTWRHNNVLLAIAKAVQERVADANSKPKPKETKQIAPLQSAFVRAGQSIDSKKKSTKKDAPHLLQAANDWKCDVDLPEFRSPGSSYVFPHDVCLTTTKIDGYILSRSARICIGLELTCPMEENLSKQHSFKQEKYEEVALEAAHNGWKI